MKEEVHVNSMPQVNNEFARRFQNTEVKGHSIPEQIEESLAKPTELDQMPTKVVNFGDTGETLDRDVDTLPPDTYGYDKPFDDNTPVLQFEDDIVMPNTFTISQNDDAIDRGNLFEVEMAVLRKSFDQIMHENFQYE